MPTVFNLVVALTPLSVYLLVLGSHRLTNRPLVTTAVRDRMALVFAISGLLLVGPGELFLISFLEPAARQYGGYVWFLFILLSVLLSCLFILAAPRSVLIYGSTAGETALALRRVLGPMDESLLADHDERSMHLPTVGLHVRVDGVPWVDHSSISVFEPNVSDRFFEEVQGGLRRELPILRQQALRAVAAENSSQTTEASDVAGPMESSSSTDSTGKDSTSADATMDDATNSAASIPELTTVADDQDMILAVQQSRSISLPGGLMQSAVAILLIGFLLYISLTYPGDVVDGFVAWVNR
ncbi:MAG: hypothetical protein AAFP90_14330 [Planctomycetota bacterium]